MQREIKFRAWVVKEKRMIYLASDMTSSTHMQINNHSWGVFEPDRDDYYGVATANNHRGDILMQYTGLMDRNGKEIYEGDIVKGYIPEMAHEPERIGFVKWGLYGWIIDFKYPKYKSGIGIVGFCSFHNYEVIGDIHNNPELLESEV